MSEQKPRVLSIDDNHANQALIGQGFGSKYQIDFEMNAEEGISRAIETLPDLILLDVNLPDIDGFEVCKKIRLIDELKTVPVLFISALTSLDDRLQGYKAGGDDYICKPINIDELRLKIEVNLASKQKASSLQAQLKSASETAMTAMTTNGETGLVLNYIIDSYQCGTCEELAVLTFNYLNSFGLNSCTQFRTQQGRHNYSCKGQLKPLEVELLTEAEYSDRIVHFGNKSIFNTAHASLLIKNMPVDNQDLYGRINDHIAIALKGTNEWVNTYRLKECEASSREEKVSNSISLLRDELRDIDISFNNYGHEMKQLVDNLIVELEQDMIAVGLTEGQEERLIGIIKDNRNRIDDMQDLSDEMEQRLLRLENSFIEATH